jgi:hypothetical protein
LEDLGGDGSITYNWICKKQVRGVVFCVVYWIYLLRIVTSGKVGMELMKIGFHTTIETF